ncbi:type VI secretion system baseplate subunit TssG [Janthinobacterium sp. PC23-8]|uniref:type VI secretion system baseplate subunit TssG n=1 Tax=Janthinobacterium sp. PC23-8 TaxID=2012679 RepID=UPI000B966930|nr:type VI secretion system baseplate subunit TssG [Janthinobacterium sp. PC23-8]OYO27803.1 hypothetical protein CD932_22000 [Janthinobacterium sp. PC23-8]
MQTEKRHAISGVIAHLMAEPWRYQFMQAVGLLLRWLRQQGVPSEQALDEVLHFRNSLSLGFPASQLERLSQQEDGRIAITPAFIGLLGGSGALPLHYTQGIANSQAAAGDDGATAFLDIFSHRMVTLFYRACGKYRLEHKADVEAKDEQLPMLLALAGIPAPGGQPPAGKQAAAWYAGLLRNRPACAHAMAKVLADHCRIPIELEQFAGAWDYLPQNRLSRLGSVNFTLGRGATVGLRLWRHDRRVRLHIGPVDEANLQRFLPRGAGAQALAQMLALFGATGLQLEVRLVLSAPCITKLVLHSHPARQRRLGWSTFLPTRQGQVQGAEVRYLLSEARTI